MLSVAQLLAFAPWLSASAVAPLLQSDWHLERLDLPLLTVSVQLGFAAGALLLAASGAADVVPARFLFTTGALVAAGANLGFAFVASDTTTAVPFRFLTGAALAAVYPVAMKVVAGWFKRERGVAIGVLIGALTIGTALPYLFDALGAPAGSDWHTIVAFASVGSVAAAVLGFSTIRPGPFEVRSPRFSVRLAARAFASQSVRLANLGYLGHSWEIYAMWTWVPLFLAASFAAGGLRDPSLASLGAFAVVAAGGAGCIVAGFVADRVGRTAVTIGAMACSGISALAIGFLFGALPILTLAVAIFWGVTIVADFGPVLDGRDRARTAGNRGLRPLGPDCPRLRGHGRHHPRRRSIGAGGWVRVADRLWTPGDRTGRRDRRDGPAARSARRAADGERPSMTGTGGFDS